MNALLIEFDQSTGRRAGDINPRDPALRCNGWQDLESEPAREIRVIEDDRDISQYEGIDGVTVLHGKDEINSAIDNLNLESHSIDDENLFRESLSQKQVDLSQYEGWSTKDILKDLRESKGVIGIAKMTPRKL